MGKGEILASRLKLAVQKEGGLGRLVEKSGISRAQLSRYLGGTPIPSDRLIKIAPLLNVTSAWLLGEESSTRESFIGSLERMRNYAERLIRLLQRYDVERAFLPPEIARVLELMVLSQQNTVEALGEVDDYTDYDLENGLNFLNNIRKNDWLDVYVDGCKYIMQHGVESLERVWAGKWAAITQEAFKLHFTREPLITDYYVRLNAPIWGAHLAMMQYWSSFLIQNFQTMKAPIRLLDAGCGNGRHLIFLNQMGDRFDLRGIDTSDAALGFCRKHEEAGTLPAGATRRGDFFAIEAEEASFDAYMSIANLMFIPLIPDSLDVGVGRALAEAARVLKPGGYALVLIRSESPDEYFPVFQCSHAPHALEKVMKKTGFKLVERKPLRMAEPGLPGTRYGRGLKNQDFWILQKS